MVPSSIEQIMGKIGTWRTSKKNRALNKSSRFLMRFKNNFYIYNKMNYESEK